MNLLKKKINTPLLSLFCSAFLFSGSHLLAQETAPPSDQKVKTPPQEKVAPHGCCSAKGDSNTKCSASDKPACKKKDARILKKFDKNGDGVLDTKEKEKARQACKKQSKCMFKKEKKFNKSKCCKKPHAEVAKPTPKNKS